MRVFIVGLCLLQFLCLVSSLEGGDAEVRFQGELDGVVVSEPRPFSKGARVFNVQANLEGRGLLIQFKDSPVPWQYVGEVRRGAHIRFDAELKSLSRGELGWADLFSYQAYLMRRGVQAEARGRVLAIREAGTPISYRQRMLKKLRQAMGSSDASSVLLSVVFGEKNFVSYRTRQTFNRTGTAHLLVVSGFHIGLVYLAVLSIGKRLFSQSETLCILYPVQAFAAVPALLAALGYLLLSGANIPALRAFIFVCIHALSAWTFQKSCFVRSFEVSFLIFLLAWPGVFLELGFQLSCGALLGIYSSFGVLTRLEGMRRVPWLVRSYLKSLVVSTAAWLGTAPVLYLWFGDFYPWSPIINSFFVPVFSMAVISFGGASVVWSMLGLPGADYFSEAALFVTELVLDVLFWIDDLVSWG